MTTPAPFPSTESAQPQQPQSSGMDFGPYQAMMGVQQQKPQTNNAAMLRRQQIESVASQVRSLSQSLDGIAQQFPSASQEIHAIKAGLTRVLVRIVGSSEPESQPSTGAMG